MQAYYKFCNLYGLKPLLHVASELTLRYFCASVSSTLSYQTIKVYLAGIRLLHLEKGFHNPTRNTDLLTLLRNGIRRSGRPSSGVRALITISLLRKIKNQLSQADIPSFDKLLYWAAFTLAFYGFLRVSEYSYPSQHKYNRSHHLLQKDIHVASNQITLTLKRSKTDRFRRSMSIIIGSTGSSTCPVQAMRKYLSKVKHKPNSPLFILTSGHLLTRVSLSSTLKRLLTVVLTSAISVHLVVPSVSLPSISLCHIEVCYPQCSLSSIWWNLGGITKSTMAPPADCCVSAVCSAGSNVAPQASRACW